MVFFHAAHDASGESIYEGVRRLYKLCRLTTSEDARSVFRNCHLANTERVVDGMG